MSFLFPPRVGPERIVEASTIYVDRDDELFTGGGEGTRRDLLGHTLRRAQNLSLNMYRTNPLANRIIRIHTTFMAGTGFAVGADNPDVQAVIDEFWGSERNRLDLHHRDRSRDYLIFGESILPAGVDEVGNTTVGVIDPTVVKDIHRSERSNLILEAVELDYSVTSPNRILSVIRADEDPASATVGLLGGDVFAWLYDRIGAASRGTPLLLPVLDWLDAYDQTLWEMAERVKAVRAFFWDVEVDGGKADIEEAQKLWGVTPPRSGSVRFRTPAMRVTAAQPHLGTVEDVAAARYLLRLIATGAGVAPHWLGDPEDANRSTAESMDKPVLRSLVDIQADWRMRVEQMLRFAVDQKVAAGVLPAVVQRHDEKGRPLPGDMNRVPAHDTITVTVPEITDDRVVEAAGALSTVLTAFLAADTLDVVDRNTMVKVVRQMLPSLGVPADALPEPDEDATPTETADRMRQALESLDRESRRLSNRV